MILQSVLWKDGEIVIIDQTKLPERLEYKTLKNIDDVTEAILNMRVRGAPLLGAIGALGLALIAYNNRYKNREELLRLLDDARKKILDTRPTAVNLAWGVNRVYKKALETEGDIDTIVEEATKILHEDIRINRSIASLGSKLINDGDTILTHCNTGSLATVSIGTALGVILEALREGKNFEVYITETRPKLQGARLTAFELLLAGKTPTLIVDSAVAYTIKNKKINKIFVGADRILKDGTTYNKIGTLQIALAAKEYGAEFYVVAPSSTFDLEHEKKEIEVEIRDGKEITHIGNVRIAPEGVNTFNPAFDETPPKFITAFITEKGIIEKPFHTNIPKILS